MSKYLAIVFLIAIFGIILTYQNCAKPSNPNNAGPDSVPNSVKVTGVVKQLNLDGCSNVIVSDADGTSQFIPYGVDPSTLPVNSHVSVSGHFPPGVVSNCMAGTILQIDNIGSVAPQPSVTPSAKAQNVPMDTVVY